MTDKAIWDEAIGLAEQMLGEGCCYISKDGCGLTVKHKDATLFQLQKKYDKDYISMHLRASLLPNEAAWIASSFFVNMDFVLGENFDFTEDKTVLFGIESLQYAADNIHRLWSLDKIPKDKDLEADEMEEAKMDQPVARPKGTSLH